MKRPVTIHYLEMLSPEELRPAKPPLEAVEVRRAEIPCPELNRFLYTAVGGDWYWVDRLPWTYAQWKSYLDRPELETWIGSVTGTPVGYFELESQPERQVEIAYFGLLPQFIGKGIGGWLLTAAVQRAWEMGAKRVWVHTCTLDGPAALQNYLSRGFRLYREETAEVELPDQTPGPWQGAFRESRFERFGF